MVQVHPDPPNSGAIAHHGRAPALHAGGGRFESAWLHQFQRMFGVGEQVGEGEGIDFNFEVTELKPVS